MTLRYALPASTNPGVRRRGRPVSYAGASRIVQYGGIYTAGSQGAKPSTCRFTIDEGELFINLKMLSPQHRGSVIFVGAREEVIE